MKTYLVNIGLLSPLLDGSSIHSNKKESALGHRIVTAAEHDRWKEAHEEIHVDVKCSAEEIVVMLKGNGSTLFLSGRF